MPDKYYKQIRQRVSEIGQRMPRSPNLKAAMMFVVMSKMLRSPSTGASMQKIIAGLATKKAHQFAMQEQRTLQSFALRLKKYKTSKNQAKFKETHEKLLEIATKREMSRKLNMHYNQVHRLLTYPTARHGRAVSVDMKKKAIAFYSDASTSLQLPFKRYSKYFYLRTPLSIAYENYAEHQRFLGFDALSATSVYRCLKKSFRTMRKIPFKDCQCAQCVNFSFLSDSLIVHKVKGIHRRITLNILRSFCPVDKEELEKRKKRLADRQPKLATNRRLEFGGLVKVTDHNRDCIFRQCQQCSPILLQEKIIEENPNIDWNKEVTWSQWVTREVTVIRHVRPKKNGKRSKPGDKKSEVPIPKKNGEQSKPEDKKSEVPRPNKKEAEKENPPSNGDAPADQENGEHVKPKDKKSEESMRKVAAESGSAHVNGGNVNKKSAGKTTVTNRDDVHGGNVNKKKSAGKTTVTNRDDVNGGNVNKKSAGKTTATNRDDVEQNTTNVNCAANNGAENVNQEHSENVKPDEKKTIRSTYNHTDKVRFRGKLSELFALYIHQLHDMSMHLFHFRFQSTQFIECKQQLQPGDVMMVMDFAQNFSHHRQDEIQGAFWNRAATTLHPIVTYYPCMKEGCTQLVKDEIMLISQDKTHDYLAVNAYLERALKYLKEEKGIEPKRLILWSDNCASQYKCRQIFKMMSEETKVPCQRNYFCAKHGKAEADGAIGRLSQHIDAVVRSGSHEFGSAKELVAYCREKLTFPVERKGQKDDMCAHHQRHYFEVSKIDRSNAHDAKLVKGTMGLHCVRNTGRDSFIEVRESSCFCDVCFLNADGDCYNEHLMKPFGWAALHTLERDEKKKLLKEFQNTLWEDSSRQYEHIKYHFIPKFPKKDTDTSDKDADTSEKTKGKKRKVDLLCPTVRVEKIEESYKGLVNEDELDDSAYFKLLDTSGKSDVEDDIPLAVLQRWLREQKQNTPGVSSRTRGKKAKAKTETKDANFVLCETEGELYDLEDYEQMGRNADVIETSTPSHGKEQQVKANISLTPISRPNDESFQSHFPDIQFLDQHDASFTFEGFHLDFQKCQNYTELKELILARHNEIPPLPERYISDVEAKSDRFDKGSRKHIPDDLPPEFSEHDIVHIKKDGNCYCSSLSRHVYGTPENHIEMRCRLTVDSVLHMDNYLNHDYLMREAEHLQGNCSNMTSECVIYSKVRDGDSLSQSEEGIKDAFMKEVFRVSREFQTCGLWQFHSGANVLQCPVYMAFPTKDIRDSTRAQFNRVFVPGEKARHNKMLGLLWTPSDERPVRTKYGPKKTLTYDHIVPFVLR